MMSDRRWLIGAGAATLIAISAATAWAQTRAGTVRISQVQVAFMLSGNVGGGTLTFKGKEYDFTIGGLGVGGFGASRMEARGDVFGLTRLEDFEGAYAQVRAGAVAGKEQIGGALVLANPAGVEMRLSSTREGYALSLGGDAIYIKFD